MAIAINQTTIGSFVKDSAGTTITFTTTGTVAAGALIVVGIQWVTVPTTVLTVTDNDAGTAYLWTIDKQQEGGKGWGAAIATTYATTGLPSGTIITATFGASTAAQIIGGASWTGTQNASRVDGTPRGITDATTTQPWSTGNYTVQAGSLIVAYCVNADNGSVNTPTAPSLQNYAQVSPGTDYGGVMDYRIESGAGSVPVAGSWGTACNSSNIAVAYLAVPDGALSRPSFRHAPGTGLW